MASSFAPALPGSVSRVDVYDVVLLQGQQKAVEATLQVDREQPAAVQSASSVQPVSEVSIQDMSRVSRCLPSVVSVKLGRGKGASKTRQGAITLSIPSAQ